MNVSDEAFAYLVNQAGDINDLKDDRAAWEAAYVAKLEEQYRNIEPYLPRQCARILDVGGGLGGINLQIAKHCCTDVSLWIVDGINDAPHTVRHDKTHSNIAVARRFLNANGLNGGAYAGFPWRCDLVVSFAAWCFHFPPSEYLESVAKACPRDGVMILDVRRGKPDWESELAEHFEPVAVALEATKYRRMVFARC